MAVNFELYKVFLAAATNRSFSKAAEELTLTQSAVSQSISRLEGELGKKLFERKNTGLSLTEYGKLLFETVSTGCNILFSAESKLKNDSPVKNIERLKIACSPIMFKKLVFPILSSCLENNINIYANSLDSDKDKVFFVKENIVDFCLIKDYGIPIDLDLIVKEALKLNYVFFYNPKFFNISSLDELSKYPLIIKAENTKARKEFDKIFSNIANNCPQKIEVSHDDLVITATESGLGVGFAPREYISKDMEILVPDVEYSKQILLVTKQNTELTDKLLKTLAKMN